MILVGIENMATPYKMCGTIILHVAIKMVKIIHHTNMVTLMFTKWSVNYPAVSNKAICLNKQ